MNDRPYLGRRVVAGFGLGPALRLGPRGALLVVGPTQSGKTTSLVVPALLRWSGPAVVASVKGDVVAATRPWRERLGRVQTLEPGREGGLTWDPLEGVSDLRGALRAARDLTLGSGRPDAEFWNALAAKLVAGVMVLALERDESVFEVAAAVAGDLVGYVRSARPGGARTVVADLLEHDGRTVDGVVTTAEAMLAPWQFPQPLARVGPVLEGAHTLYLCAPRADQRHYEPLFRGALRRVLELQQRRSEHGESERLLVVLDEAAHVASLDELDQVAATVSGLGVTLVTVVQDFAQLRARFGERAATIVNNHATRVVLSGLSDPSAARYLPELAPPARPAGPGGAPRARAREAGGLRTRRPGRAVVVAGHRPALEVALVPWWRQRALRPRGAPSG
ncbi:MAG TPA: type IV secretory system conjugative DNA transfer family protein [Acidimicrobiales bacterium]|nr:type IV secretory system conjugative DNA transfer family protein [Acidimicrobiales bacterium]